VNGSLTSGGARARKRERPPVAKGGRFTRARRSSSRERRVFGESHTARVPASARTGARGDGRWKTPWIEDAHAFHEALAEPVLAAFEPPRGICLTAPTPTSKKEATRVSEANGIDSKPREDNALGSDRPCAEVGGAP